MCLGQDPMIYTESSIPKLCSLLTTFYLATRSHPYLYSVPIHLRKYPRLITLRIRDGNNSRKLK